MAERKLENLRIAAIMTDGFEEIEFTSPRDELVNNGAIVHILAPAERKTQNHIQAMRHMNFGEKFEIDSDIEEANPEDYDAVLLPGGVVNADKLRINESMQNFVRQINDENKPIFVICHGPWLLISAGLVRGRKMTSYRTIKDDMINAGAMWVDDHVVIDDNFISSRSPGDLPYFNEAMIEKLTKIDEISLHEHARKVMMGEE